MSKLTLANSRDLNNRTTDARLRLTDNKVYHDEYRETLSTHF